MSKKLIFFGAMAAILVSVGAASAAVPSIASKGYVDAQVDTRMLKSADVTGTATGAITGATVGADGGLDLTRALITSTDVDDTIVTTDDLDTEGFVKSVTAATGTGMMDVATDLDGDVTISRRQITSADVNTTIATGVARDAAETGVEGNVISSVTFDNTTGDVIYTTATVATSEGLEELTDRVTVNEGDITAIEGDITTIEGDITTIETELGNKMDNDVTVTGTGDIVTSVVLDTINGGIDVTKGDISDLGGIPMPDECANGGVACSLTFIAGEGLTWLPLYGAGTDGAMGADEILADAVIVEGSEPPITP